MCGISLLYNPNLSAEAQKLWFLSWMEQETRGRDASGIFALLHDGRVLYAKAPIRATEFIPAIKDYVDRHGLRIMYALGHARAATHGSPSINRNNHPILRVQDGITHVVVHNGIVHSSLCTTKLTQTDTEEILCALMPVYKSPIAEVANALSKVYGSFAIGYFAVGSPGIERFIIARQHSPLYRQSIDGAYIYASYFTNSTTVGHVEEVRNGLVIDVFTGEEVALQIQPYGYYYVPGDSRTEYLSLYTGYIDKKHIKANIKGVAFEGTAYFYDEYISIEAVAKYNGCSYDVYAYAYYNGEVEVLDLSSQECRKTPAKVIRAAEKLGKRLLSLIETE